MLYAASHGKKGLRVFLGVTKENVDKIRADEPLMAQMLHVGGNGVFFIYLSEDGSPSPQFQKALDLMHRFPIDFAAISAKKTELDALEQNLAFLTVDPKNKLPGIELITVVFCRTQQDLFNKLKEKGLITNRTEVRHIPKGGVESN